MGVSTRGQSGDVRAVSSAYLGVLFCIFFQMSSAGLFWTPLSPSVSQVLENQMSAMHAEKWSSAAGWSSALSSQSSGGCESCPAFFPSRSGFS